MVDSIKRSNSTWASGGSRAATVADFLRLKATEVLAPSRFDAEDAAAIDKVRQAIIRRDEPAMLEVLKHAGPRLAKKLWEAELPAWIPSEKYLEVLSTTPGESWKVDWTYDFDENAARADLVQALPFLKKPLEEMLVFKKNFPAGEQRTPGKLVGYSTYGYQAGVKDSGTKTPNSIRMETDEKTGRKVAVMTYQKPPHYVAGNGFFDGFRPLSPNITLAYGSYGHYEKDDLPPDAPAAVRALAGKERHTWRAQALSFFMYRTRDDAAETPVFDKP